MKMARRMKNGEKGAFKGVYQGDPGSSVHSYLPEARPDKHPVICDRRNCVWAATASPEIDTASVGKLILARKSSLPSNARPIISWKLADRKTIMFSSAAN